MGGQTSEVSQMKVSDVLFTLAFLIMLLAIEHSLFRIANVVEDAWQEIHPAPVEQYYELPPIEPQALPPWRWC